MYGGKLITEGDTVFVFASETQGGKASSRSHHHSRRTNPQERGIAAPNRARECHHQTKGACETATGTSRAQAPHRLE